MVIQDDGGCPTCDFPKQTYYTKWAQRYGDKSGGYMQTYAIAGIGVQNPYWPPRSTFRGLPRILGKNTGIGPAKITDNQMNTDYGKPVWDSEIHTLEHFRGYGLGMAGENQAKGKVSVEAMMTRIKIVMEGCDEKCTSTDLFLVAALAENGPGFNLDNMKTLQGKYGRINDGTHSLKWGDWLNDSNALSAKNQSTNRDLIAQFAGNVIFLENRGWDVPSDIDWSYVYSLTVTTVQP